MADATNKKYVDLTGLTNYDAKIKALINSKDADTLQSAKDYADGLADNYDAAGSATSALNAAKSYTDTEVAKANAAAAAAQTQADKGVADAATAKAAADAAQSDVDALETYVGTIPESSTAASVIAYVDEKTSGIASDAALTALTNRVTTAEGEIDAIQADYLKAADKTELQSGIDAVDDRVDVLVGTDTGKSVRTIANEELAAQLIPENAKESLDTLQEIAAWIQAHPDDASAMNQAIADLEAFVGEIPDGATATDIVAYIQEVVAAEKSRAEDVEGGLDTRVAAIEAKFTGTGDGSVADQIADAVAVETAAREAADTALTTKVNAAQDDVDALETLVGTIPGGSSATTVVGYVDEKVAATNSDVSALTARMATAEGEIDALQADSHTHSNKSVLDAITSAKVANWDTAYTNNHTHANKDVLDGITAAKISAWDAAESNAKSYTDAEVAKFVAVTSDEINALFA